MGRKTLWLGGSVLLAATAVVCWRCWPSQPGEANERAARLRKPAEPPPQGYQEATFGAGCFWCSEAVFQQLNGVHAAVPGYSGGSVDRPTYEQICTGKTGHAEVIHVTFDPQVISYADLLEVFWRSHDPTTLNRQGRDVGSQYRSVIFYHDDEQRRQAEQYKQQLDASGAFAAPIVTEIVPFREFHPAEVSHQDYFARNPAAPYCELVIRPKLEKFEQRFADKLKPTAQPGQAAH
jgi:peptide-methionine (S)-S-oxide reductase